MLRSAWLFIAAALEVAGLQVPPATQPISLQITPDSTTIVLGEPIVLRYELRNSSAQEARIHLGQADVNTFESVQWLGLSLQDSAGRQPSRRDDPIPRLGRMFTGPVVRVSPRSSYRGHAVVTRHFRIERPGEYTIRLHAQAPCMVGDQAERLDITPDPITVTVLPQDKAAVLRTARRLAEETQHSASSIDQRVAADALFAMPPALVAPVWMDLVKSETTDKFARGYAYYYLMRTGTKEGATALAERLVVKERDEVDPRGAQMALMQMYKYGDKALKQHVAALYKAKTGRSAEKDSVGSEPID